MLCADLSHVAGLKFEDFKELVSVFQSVGAEWVNVYTCFGGGLTRSFFEKMLQDMNAQFIAVAYGMNELGVKAHLIKDWELHVNNGHIEAQYPYSIGDCFAHLGDSIGKIKDAKTLEQVYQLCADGLQYAVWLPTTPSNQQPFVYLPTMRRFKPVAIDPKVMIVPDAQEVKALDACNYDAVVIQQPEVHTPICLNMGSFLVSSIQPEACDDKKLGLCAKKDPGITHTLDYVEIHGLLPNMGNFDGALLKCLVEKNISFNKTFVIKKLLCFAGHETREIYDVVIRITCKKISVLDNQTDGEVTLEYRDHLGIYRGTWALKELLPELKIFGTSEVSSELSMINPDHWEMVNVEKHNTLSGITVDHWKVAV